MKKKIIFWLLVVLIISCMKMEEKYQTIGDYTKWKKPVDKVLDYAVPGHGKDLRVIYANSKAFEVKQKKKGNQIRYKFPDGSIIVKAIYANKADVGKNEKMITYMVKESKNPKSQDNWLYFMQKKGEKPVLVGSKMCIRCHEAANETHQYFDGNKNGDFMDYIFVPFNK